MSHIKDRLIQLKNEVESTGDGAYLSKNNISKIVELLLADLEQDEKENGWIPVSERLPEDDTTVLVSCKTRSGTTFVRAGYCIYGSWHLNCEGVTAWRPLPEPYKEN
jgi:hypothetical protein